MNFLFISYIYLYTSRNTTLMLNCFVTIENLCIKRLINLSKSFLIEIFPLLNSSFDLLFSYFIPILKVPLIKFFSGHFFPILCQRNKNASQSFLFLLDFCNAKVINVLIILKCLYHFVYFIFIALPSVSVYPNKGLIVSFATFVFVDCHILIYF